MTTAAYFIRNGKRIPYWGRRSDSGDWVRDQKWASDLEKRLQRKVKITEPVFDSETRIDRMLKLAEKKRAR